MPELLKHMYNARFFEGLSQILEELLPSFNTHVFKEKIFTPAWDTLELKQRMRHITGVLSEHLPGEFPEALPYILAIKNKAIQKSLPPFAYMFLPDYLEQYGLAYAELSVQAMEEITTFISAEFAVRPFLIKYPEFMLGRMMQWSTHSSEHVRRLASEGIRPWLPWAMAVPALKKDPRLILPILENLKADPSEYVRRSIANNLNDISKDHPQLVTELAYQWKGIDSSTDKLLKHACRTLLKKGDPQIINLFGFSPKESISLVQPLVLNKSVLSPGETLEFTCSCSSRQLSKIRLQYLIDFPRKRGKSSNKVFYLGEKTVGAGEEYIIRKKFKLQEYSTRKLYAGTYHIAIMLNGEIKTEAFFQLTIH